VEQVAADGINLPVFHDGGLLLAGDSDLEQRVVASGGAENLPHLFGIDAERKRIALVAVKNGGNFAGDTQAAGFILAARIAGSCFDYDLVCHCLLSFSPKGSGMKPLLQIQIKSSLIEVSS
jgi:hypothetical protein